MELTPRNQRGTIQYPVTTFGRSVLGCPLEVILPTNNKPKFLVLAGQHGDEPETTSLLSAVVRTIPGENLCCAVVLAANPDGLLRGTRGNANGVDLNRNFQTSNWSSDKVVYRWSNEDPRDVELSPGKTPLSEPETKAILQLVQDLNPEAIISVHAPLGCVDDPQSSELAKWLSKSSKLPLVGDIGYPTPGSFGTWALENKKPLITFELPHDSIESHRAKLQETFINLLIGETH